ncbi:hypothetical protein ASPZODRAFT_134473 [Penicilliopsis zonata CBS 506.65]|uniref:AB hydrolase-1 domain-containing protein n=1 Tax=Penicilliopsis zonata CBS 506.65 TaxID=1073090 RepID=A0A1L9SCY0_9EURO|nr:hypothetical protein ASPZODRAFT_134473 [Penicilliopsis zonata CBS 506.65]OJJ45046.1 hypothetical protein ASPZODRAFT_134473 [Penicilliopsis zonata CBS 506.65]
MSWNEDTRSDLVSIGTHRLFLSASGPTRETIDGHLQPAVIIEAGLASSHCEWVAVQRLLAESVRVYSYDRAGYGLSEESPDPVSVTNRVRELTLLLKTAEIAPPYILVGHSYGGVLIREFLRQHGPQDVAGMVIVDSSRERTPLPPGVGTLVGDGEASYMAIVGLDASHVLTAEEYQAVKDEEERNAPTANAEDQLSEAGRREVNEALPIGMQALEDSPLSVIFGNESVDFRKIYDFSVAHGTGTEEARQRLAVRLEDMEQLDEQGQRDHLSLSSRSRFVYAEGKARTHNIQLVAPELIRDEVLWVNSLV